MEVYGWPDVDHPGFAEYMGMRDNNQDIFNILQQGQSNGMCFIHEYDS